MSTPVTQIVMVGPRGVGKTSLLAAMYNELDAEMIKLNGQIQYSDPSTQKAIKDRRDQLEDLATGKGLAVDPGAGIQGGMEELRYHFDASVNGPDQSIFRFDLEFIDLPGGWYTLDGETTNDIESAKRIMERCDQILARSHVSLWAVDANALMEAPEISGDVGQYHKEINQPSVIKESYKRAITRQKAGGEFSSHLVILTLIRAETYVKNGKQDELISRAKKAYNEFAALFANNNIKFVGCYVETVGSLIFSNFKNLDGKTPVAEFVRNSRIGYKPERCSIPLKLAIREAASHSDRSANFFLGNAEADVTEMHDKVLKISERVGKLNRIIEKIIIIFTPGGRKKLEKAKQELALAQSSLADAKEKLERAKRDRALAGEFLEKLSNHISSDDYFEINPQES